MDREKIIVESVNGLLLSASNKKEESQSRSDNCYKLIYSTSGTMYYQKRQNDFSLSGHQFIIFNPFEEHKQLALEEKKFLIELKPEFLNEVAASFSHHLHDIQFVHAVQKNPQLTNWVHFVSQYVQEAADINDPTLNLFMEHSLTQLALIMIKNAGGSHSTELNINSYKTMSPLLHKVMEAMMNDPRHSWTLEEMAQIIHLSKYQFAHLFKEVTGLSPYSWLQLYRIIRSQEALMKTNNSILSIALDSGFSSVSVYNQLFKRLYGMTPGAFRNMFRK